MDREFSGSSHSKNFCSSTAGNDRQLSATDGNQKTLPLAFGVHRTPKDAPAKLLRQIESEAQALAVSIAAGHHKLDYIAACIGKSRGYVSRLQSGQRAIPDKLVKPLCAATGTNLLAQYRELQDALNRFADAHDPIKRLARELEAA